MAPQVLTNARIFMGGADVSAASNQAEVEGEFEVKDVTTFTSGGWKAVMAGLGSGTISAAGFWEAGAPDRVDEVTWAGLGGIGPWTVTPGLADVGALAYLMRAMQASYKAGGEVGEVAPYEAEGKSAWPLARGQIAHAPGTPRTTTGVGSSVQLGAVPAGKYLYANLHVISATGTTPTITVRVESDNATGFPSPVTVAAFPVASAAGGLTVRAIGPLTDDWYRLAWTVTGTGPSFLFVGSLGIA